MLVTLQVTPTPEPQTVAHEAPSAPSTHPNCDVVVVEVVVVVVVVVDVVVGPLTGHPVVLQPTIE
jgi:hypothetical protein